MDKTTAPITSKSKTKRRALPRIDTLLEWGAVEEGDVIVARGKEDRGTLLSNGNVIVNDEEKSMQVWLREIFGWSTIQTFAYAVHEKSGKTLSQIREEYMERKKSAMVE